MGTGKFTAGGNPAMDQHPIQGEVALAILLVASCYGNRDKLRPDGPLGSYTDFNLTFNRNFQIFWPNGIAPRISNQQTNNYNYAYSTTTNAQY